MELKTIKLAVLALGCTAFSFSVTAQDKKEPDFDKMFKRYDTDTNGTISLEEFKSVKRKKEVPAERLEKNYAVLDGDSNGEVTLEELKANWGKGKGKGKKK